MAAYVVYHCEKCKNVLNDRGVGDDHISLLIGPDSGLVTCRGLEDGLAGWRVTDLLRPRRYHFCNVDCMTHYFRAVLYSDKPLVRTVN